MVPFWIWAFAVIFVIAIITNNTYFVSSPQLKMIPASWVVIGFILFIIYYHLRGLMCPCTGSKPWPLIPCYRVEYFGMQPGNVGCILLGYCIPQHLVLFLCLHVIWEMYEWIVLAPNASWIGGCDDASGNHWWKVSITDILSRPLLFVVGMVTRILIS
jgi:hypothetical protein